MADDIVYKMVRLRDANPTINPRWMALDRWLAEVAKAHGDLDRLVRTDIFDLENNYSGDFINITEEEYNSMDIISGIIIDRPTWDAFLTSINSYADVPVHWPNETSVEKTNWPCEKLGTKSLYFTATEEDLLVTILGSLDGGLTFPITAESEFAVDVGSPVLKPISNFYHALKIQVKPAVDDAHGTLEVSGGGTSIPGMSDVEVTALLDKTGLATQTTLAAILAKLITAPSTEAKQDTIKTAIDAITTKLSADPATQTTLADVKTAVEALAALITGGNYPVTGPLTADQRTAQDPATATNQTAGNASLSSIDDKIQPNGVLAPKYGIDTVLCTTEAVAISTLVELGSIDCSGYNKLLLDWKLIWANGSGTGTAYIDVYPQDIGSSPATYSKPMSSKRIAIAPVTGSPYTAMDFSELDITGQKSIKLYCTGSGGAALTATVAYRLVV